MGEHPVLEDFRSQESIMVAFTRPRVLRSQRRRRALPKRPRQVTWLFFSLEAVKCARLSQGWRRRNRLTEQREEQRRTTAEAVANAVASGGRNYGRNYRLTALRLEGHRARFDDIAHELQ